MDSILTPDFGIFCLGGAGGCVDLDGTTNNGAEFSPIATLDLVAGQIYYLSYGLSGSQRSGTNTVTVSLGGVLQSHTLAANAPFSQFTLVVAPGADLLGQSIVFDQAGGDNVGLILDSVTLTEAPEPGSVLLMGLGLAGIGLLRRRRV